LVFSLGVWAVDGQTNDAALARLQLQAATSGAEGVVGAGDLVVTATPTPGSSVLVGGGACTVVGKEASFQGSYFGYNVGAQSVPITATGGGGGRSDLIVARVEDPTVAGTPWTHDPATDSLIYARVIEGVAPSTTKAPADQSAIALARIDIPASTSTITQAMIHDLRGVDDNVTDGNGRQQRALRIQRGVSPIDLAGNIKTPDWENWPDLVWTVVVPSWATQAQIVAHWGSVMFQSSDGNGDATGATRIALGVGGTTVYTNSSAYNFNINTGNAQRVDMLNADQVNIPAALRGHTCNLSMQVSGGATTLGRLRADGWANFYVDIEFLEVPVPNIDA
jgi:hypothetical protein